MSDITDDKPDDEVVELTDKQQRFVEEYCLCFNGAEAARKAGYSEESARFIGHENLTKPYIKKLIDAKMKELTMGVDEALMRMSDFARGSFKSFVDIDDDENLTVVLNSEEAKRNIHLIKKIKQTKRKYGEGGQDIITEIELHDAKDAVAKILQMHGKLVDKKQIDHTSNGETITIFQLPDNGRSNE